jgi:hypothetical protein
MKNEQVFGKVLIKTSQNQNNNVSKKLINTFGAAASVERNPPTARLWLPLCTSTLNETFLCVCVGTKFILILLV